MTTPHDSYHIVLLGEPWTGKHSFCKRLQLGTFSEDKVGVPGNELFTIPLSKIWEGIAEGETGNLTIDKVGVPALVGVSNADFVPSRARVDAIVVLVSVCDYVSMTALEKWKLFAERTCKGRVWRGTVYFVLSTFCDKPSEERLMLPGEVERAAKERGFRHADISNKTGAGVRATIMSILHSIRQAKGEPTPNEVDFAELLAKVETAMWTEQEQQELTPRPVTQTGSAQASHASSSSSTTAFSPSNTPSNAATGSSPTHAFPEVSQHRLKTKHHPTAASDATSPSTSPRLGPNIGPTSGIISTAPVPIPASSHVWRGHGHGETTSHSASSAFDSSSTNNTSSGFVSAASQNATAGQATRDASGESNTVPSVVILPRDSPDSSGAMTPDLPLLRLPLPDTTTTEKKRPLSPSSGPRGGNYVTALNPDSAPSTPGSHSSTSADSLSASPRKETPRSSPDEHLDARAKRRTMMADMAITSHAQLLDADETISSPRTEARRSLKLRRLINTSRSPTSAPKEPSSSSPPSLNDRPRRQPTKIDFQKDALFDSKKRQLIISGEHLFVYKKADAKKVLKLTIELIGTTTKRPKEGSLKVKLSVPATSTSAATSHTVKFGDEGSLALFRGKVSSHSQTAKKHQTLRESTSLVAPLFSTVVSGNDALMLLRTNEENCYCAECSEQHPEFAVTNLGILVCGECAKIHRLLALPSVQVVKIEDQFWNPFLLDMMMWLSNDVANSIWEETLLKKGLDGSFIPGLPEKPLDESPFQIKSAFIHAKYEQRAYLEAGYLGSLLNMDDALPNMGLNVALKIAASQPKHLASLARFLAHDVSPNSALDSQTVLHVACMSGNYLAVMLLLQNGADVNAKDSFAAVPLDHSVEFDRAAAQLIIEQDLSKVPRDLLMLCGDDPHTISSLDLEWPNASSILIDYGAISRPVGSIVNKKTDAIGEAASSSRPSSQKAAMLLGLLDNPDRPVVPGSLRLSSARVPPSLSPEIFKLATSLPNKEVGVNNMGASSSSGGGSGLSLSPPSSGLMSSGGIGISQQAFSAPSSPLASPRSLLSSTGDPGSFRTLSSELSSPLQSPSSSTASATAGGANPASPLASSGNKDRVPLAQTTWKSTPGHSWTPRQMQGRELLISRRGRHLDPSGGVSPPTTSTDLLTPASPSSPSNPNPLASSGTNSSGPQSSPNRTVVLAGTD